MKNLVDFLTVLSGLAAAYFWYKASKVVVTPNYAKPGGSGFEPVNGSEGQWIAALLEAAQESGRLNIVAARLTAISVFLTTLSLAFDNLNWIWHLIAKALIG